MIKPVCPHCDVALERRSNKGVFQYACPKCLGFAVHFGGLREVMKPEALNELWRKAPSSPTGDVACSHCRKKMKVLETGTADTQLDLCLNCDLIWLDTGEWKNLESAKEPAPQKSAAEIQLEYGRLIAQFSRDGEEARDFLSIRDATGSISGRQMMIAILGIPVEEEAGEDEFARRPFVTWGLILACVLLTGWAFRHDWVAAMMAYSPASPFPLSLVQMVSSFFIHASILHLFGNMYFLWVFGDNVEDHIGKPKYALLLLLSTLCGALLFSWFHAPGDLLVGASGGISGVVAYYLIRFPKRRFVIFFFFRWLSVRAALFGAFYFGKEFIGAVIESTGTQSGVAHLAHIGGGLVGVAFAWALSPDRELKNR